MKIVIHGAAGFDDVPGLAAAGLDAEIAFAPDEETLGVQLPGAEILFGWNFRGRDLVKQWHRADRLKWIQWCGAGVDAVLFPALAESSTVLTNARGIYDRAMAEYVLCYMLSEAKDFRTTLQQQSDRNWNFRVTTKIAGSRAAIYGVGSIGRELAVLLKSVGVAITGVGRSARDGDDVFGSIRGQADALAVAGDVDWIIGVLPGTEETRDFFTAEFLASLKPTARFINIGRGDALDEDALVACLETGKIAGAMLDVFRVEPLPADSVLWTTRNLVVSPHMSGDHSDCEADVLTLFLTNLKRYQAGAPLVNIVDKKLGFVRS